MIEKATLSGLPFMLLGDFNIDLSTKTHISKQYTEILETYHCVQIVKQATRISSNKKSLIDHCICNTSFLIEAHVLNVQVADHQPLLLSWHQKLDKDSLKIDKQTKLNYQKLKDMLNKQLPELDKLDCNKAFNILHNTVTTAVEKCKYQVSRKNKPKKP